MFHLSRITHTHLANCRESLAVSRELGHSEGEISRRIESILKSNYVYAHREYHDFLDRLLHGGQIDSYPEITPLSPFSSKKKASKFGFDPSFEDEID